MIEPDESGHSEGPLEVGGGGGWCNREDNRASGLGEDREGGGAAHLKEQGIRRVRRISSAALSVQIGCRSCMPEFI